MDKLIEQWFAQAPTVVVMIYIFSQLRIDVKDLLVAILRLLEMCMKASDNDAENVKERLD